MAKSQNYWGDYINLFPIGEQIVIQSLRTTYEKQFSVGSFQEFEIRLQNKDGLLQKELATIPADTIFITSLSQWLLEKAVGVESWEVYPERFQSLREFAGIIAQYYSNMKVSIEEFRNYSFQKFSQELVYAIAESNKELWFAYAETLIDIYSKLSTAIVILKQPSSIQGACPGDKVTFSVGVYPKDVLFQWQRNGENINGAIESSFELELVEGDQNAEITVLLSRLNRIVTSEPAYISLNIPVIKTQPQNVSAVVGGTARFSILVTGENITYQWRKNQVPLDGETNSVLILTLVNLKNIGLYDCVVSTDCQTKTSAKAALEVLNSFTVNGKILTASRQPAQAYTVKAYHFEKGQRYLLGETQTDQKGNYFIPYTSQEFGLSKSGRANLSIEVTHQGVNQKSPLFMRASGHQVINMITTAKRLNGVNEFEQINEWFANNVQNFNWNDADEKDVVEFADNSNYPKSLIKAYLQAKSFSTNENQIEGYYGLLRSNDAFKKKQLLHKKDGAVEKMLRLAKEKNIISASFDEQVFLNAITTEFNNEVNQLIDTSADNKVSEFVELANFENASSSTKTKFFDLQRQYQDNPTQFWNAVDSDADLNTYSQGLKLASQMGAVTAVNMGLMRQIKNSHSTITKAEDLVVLTESDLENDIINSKSTIPGFIKGTDVNEKRKNYARWISERIEESYPTSYMRARIEENSSFPSQSDFSTFFDNNSNFQLDKKAIHQYLNENPNALEGISDTQTFTNNLLKVQRFHTIAPRGNRARVTNALIAKSYQSAPQVAQTPYSTFMANVTDTLDYRTASQVYKTAREVTGRSINFLSKYHSGLNSSEIGVVRSNAINTGDQRIQDIFPDIDTLLGETDYCACEHCKSVFGPAAYLVDLLQFGKEIDSENVNLYELLTQSYLSQNYPRRPDIPKIDLTCDNTNVVLPTIDIINELLCKLVDPGFVVDRQTTKSAEELRIAPQYPPSTSVNDNLKTQVFPWQLPFDYYNNAVYYQLPIGNTSRSEFAWSLPQAGGNSSTSDNSELRAITDLKLSDENWARLTMNPFSVSSTYGISGSPVNYFEENGDLLVEKFINQIGISFDRFRNILKSTSLNPFDSSGNRKYQITYAGEGCSLSTARVENISNFYQRFYYLEKLSKTLKWDLEVGDHFVAGFQLMSAIDNSNSSSLTQALSNLSLVTKLSDELNIDNDKLLAWVNELSTVSFIEGTLSQYENVFLNPELVYNYSEVELGGFQLNNERSDIENPQTLEVMKNAVLASLQIAEDDLTALVSTNWLGSTDYTVTLNLKRLSQLNAYVGLANALRIDITELITLWETFNSNFTPLENNYNSLLHLYNFTRFIDYNKASSFNEAQLEYLFTAKNLEPILPLANQTEFLTQLRTNLKDKWDEKSKVIIDSRAGIQFLLTTQTISQITNNDLDQIDTIIKGDYKEDQRDELVDWWSNFQLVDLTTIDAADFENKVIINTETSSTYLKDVQERITYIFKKLSEAQSSSANQPSLLDTVFNNYLNQFALENFVSHFMDDYPEVTPLQNELLMDSNLLKNPVSIQSPIINLFTAQDFISSEEDISKENFPNIYESYQLIFKNIDFLSYFPNIKNYYKLFYTSAPENWPQPANFPTSDQASSQNSPDLSGLLNVWQIQQVESYLSLHKAELMLFLKQIGEGELQNEGDIIEQLANITSWGTEQLNYLIGSNGFNFANEYWLGSEWIFELYKAFSVADKLEINPSFLQQFNKVELNKQEAIAIQQFIRKQIESDTDKDKLIEANDNLREDLRDALMNYVIHQTDILDGALFEKSKAGLSDFLLTDIQKSSCSLTSRVKQALSTTQMLVQRCLLGIERIGPTTTFEVPASAVQEWVWRKNYRVWEANRKIFLYPENWLLPETRDDQTELYQAFIEEMSQNDINDENARRAVSNYLKSLHEISNLEICQIYHEEEYEGENYDEGYLTDTVHIFARTKNEPHIYYYRKWIDDSYFTPWQELPLEIESNYLIPTKYAGRLWLFWPIFIEKAVEEDSVETTVSEEGGGTYQSSGSQPRKYFEIRIAWSTEFQGQWEPKKMSKDVFETSPINQTILNRFFKNRFVFRTHISNEGDLIFTPGYYLLIAQNNEFNSSQNPFLLDKSLRFYSSNSQPEMIDLEDDFELNKILLPFANPYLMKNKFLAGAEVSRFNESNFTPFSELITAQTSSLATLPQQIPTNVLASDYAFFYEDEKHNFFVNPEVYAVVDEESGRTVNSNMVRIEEYSGLGNPSMDTVNQVLNQSLADDNNNLGTTYIERQLQSSSTSTFWGDDDSNGVIEPPNHTVIVGGGGSGGSSTPPSNDPPETSTPGFDFIWPKPRWLDPIEPNDPDEETVEQPGHRFYTHYHPYADDFYREVNRYGLEGIYRPLQENLKRQLAQSDFDFEASYNPTDKVIPKYPKEDIDFTSFGAYSVYNWELFYHIPMSVAQLLTANFRFAEAQQWLHYIFDPTESVGNTPERFWKIKPLYEFSKISTDEEFLEFSEGNNENLEKLVKQWEKNPFNPHLIGRFRLSTYMRRVIMVYIENLLAWADQLFTQDTIESINEAFQLYMLASRILGERPEKLPASASVTKNVEELIDPAIPNLSTALEAISDGVALSTINNDVSFNTTMWQHSTRAVVQNPQLQLSDNRRALTSLSIQPQSVLEAVSLENQATAVPGFSGIRNNYNQVRSFQAPNPEPYHPAADQFSQAAAAMNTMGYFCILPNTQLNEYWDQVEDRLYKIRHCLNIEGEERSLALFEPPIDPGAIIAALAGGASLSSAIQGLNTPLPYYRFRYLIDRALSLTAEVKGLGQSLKEALEKADNAELSLLREEQQQYVLDAVRKVKIKAVEEAQQSLVVLQNQRENVQYREQFYRSRKYTITEEDNYLKSMQKSTSQLETARALNLVIGTLSSIPEVSFGINGAFGSPHATTKLGSFNFVGATRAATEALQTTSSISSTRGGIENTKGSWLRRQDEWTFQAETAKKELAQIDEQLNAAQLRIDMAKRDLDAHDRQITNAVEMQQVIDAQFANRDLFIWMRTELSNLYRSSYNDALSLAKQTEQCFNFELWDPAGPSNAVFITTNHWDGLKKGLLAGEKLERQLRSMQLSYDDQNERLFELNKNVSLAELDPGALLRFKQTGKTTFSIPEFIFDLDYAGQYQRRIKSIAVTIPCVAGPFGNVTARLSLTGNSVRKEATLIDGEYAKQDGNDTRFQAGISAAQGLATTIGTSSGNQDRGMFEFNFNQERYLPFEGAGVISDWVLELPTVYQQFNYDSINDVILHIDYTARENTGTFKQKAQNYLETHINSAFAQDEGWSELISLKSQFSEAYYKFLHPAEESNMETSFEITNKQFPYIFNGVDTEITSMILLIRPKDGFKDKFESPQVNMILGETDNLPTEQPLSFGSEDNEKTSGLLYTAFEYVSAIDGASKNLTLEKTSDNNTDPVVVPEYVEDILLLVNFKKE